MVVQAGLQTQTCVCSCVKREGKGRKRAATVAAVGEVAALRKVKGIMDVVGQLLVQPLTSASPDYTTPRPDCTPIVPATFLSPSSFFAPDSPAGKVQKSSLKSVWCLVAGSSLV